MLTLPQFLALPPMAILTAKDCLTVIQERAIARWGDKKWLPELAREFVKIAQAEGDVEATYEKRRRQIYRTFEEWSCSTETLFILSSAVGCRFQMVCSETTVIEKVIDL